MRCAFQDVECSKCSKFEGCGMPSLIAELQQQIAKTQQPIPEKKVEPYTAKVRISKSREDV